MILVVSYPGEDHAEEVIRRLRAMEREVQLLDLADFPSRSALALNWERGGTRAIVRGPNRELDLHRVRVGWWRRVRSLTLDQTLTNPASQAFALSETAQAVNGMLDSLSCPWINPRTADETAHRKPLQLTLARQVGLTVPETLISNDPDAAREFIQRLGIGKVVCKPFLAMMEAWRETRLVTAGDLERLQSVRFAPVIFQEFIAGVDLRVTVVGDRVFAAEIDARQTSYPVDMRMVLGQSAVRATDLPVEVEKGLIRLMRRLGIVYGAIDLRKSADGTYYFLEVNPAGQWLFVEHRTGLPISQAVAELLAAYG